MRYSRVMVSSSFLNEVFREVDIFKNDIPLFYRDLSVRCLLSDRIITNIICSIRLNVNGQKCVDLGFVPFNSETFGFTGHLFVTLDSTFFVQKAILNVPKDINLNFRFRNDDRTDIRTHARQYPDHYEGRHQRQLQIEREIERYVCAAIEYLQQPFF